LLNILKIDASPSARCNATSFGPLARRSRDARRGLATRWTDKDGKMAVDQAKFHKVPELKQGQWIEVPRYEWKDLGSSHLVP
jgi:hypothetical protein